MKPIISGIQQVGVGIPDVGEAWKWYRQALGFDVPIFDDPGTAGNMLPYTGGQPQSRHAILAVNMQGGGGLEIWQYTSRTPQPPAFDIQLGDLGIFMARMKTQNIEAAYRHLAAMRAKLVGGIEKTPEGIKTLHVKDPYGNLTRVEEGGALFMKTPSAVGGVKGVVVGVSDMEAAKVFYGGILGFDKAVYDETGVFADFSALPGGNGTFRRVLLTHSAPRQGAFSRLLGEASIELVQARDRQPKKLFENRYWGDLGFIHLCFDIAGMADMRALCQKMGHPFTVDSNPAGSGTFDMGEAAGSFAYIEDPDGTLIEFVETHKIPIAKKIGWYLDLRKRDPGKALPDWMLRTLHWNRVK